MPPRDRQLIECIAADMSKKDLAHRPHLSTHIVPSHFQNIGEKLALRDRIQIANDAHISEGFREAATTMASVSE